MEVAVQLARTPPWEARAREACTEPDAGYCLGCFFSHLSQNPLVSQPHPSLQTLQDLLGDVDISAIAHAERLRAVREQLATDPATSLDLDRLELRFLERQAGRRDVSPQLSEVIREPQMVALGRALRSIREGDPHDAAALFDLAELRASYLSHACDDEAAFVGETMRERIALVPLDDRLKGEASERYAAVLTEEEDLRSHHKVHLLREIGSLLQGLGERSSDRFYKKLARRLRNSVVDRTLYRRLEGLLSRRGVVLLESTSLCLLVLVFGLITVESLVTLDPGALWAIRVADASICSFFIAEFLFKLSLAPSKTSWFLRNFITDFLPAIPAVALLFTPGFVGGLRWPLCGSRGSSAWFLWRGIWPSCARSSAWLGSSCS